MPLRLPDLRKAKSKIDKDCTVKHHKLCAIAFDPYSGHVYAFETNRQITNDLHLVNKWTKHAEEFLIEKLMRICARQRFRNIGVVVLRWKKSTGGWAMARPCHRCEKMLDSYGVDKVYYSDDDGKIKRLW